MSIKELTLTSYFVIKNLEASEISIDGNSLNTLCASNDYVIERYSEAPWSDGNYRYIYKIYNSRQQESLIRVGKWSINSIKSNLCWNPSKWISFDLTDPKGNSCIDKRMPYTRVNSQQYQHYQDVVVSGAGVEGINRMLTLAKDMTKFDSWYYVLEDLMRKTIQNNHLAKID